MSSTVFFIQKLRARVIYECVLYSNKYGNFKITKIRQLSKIKITKIKHALKKQNKSHKHRIAIRLWLKKKLKNRKQRKIIQNRQAVQSMGRSMD